MPKYTAALRKDYQNKWDTLQVDHDPKAVKVVAQRILANKQKYSGYWNVPYWFIGLCDYRESGFHPAGVLHNGQRIIGTGKKTTIVPKGRGPFATWPDATKDALRLKGLDTETDWSIPHASYILEGFNGYGYRSKGVPSPYLYSHTNHYADGSWDDDPRGGKYIRDHVWDGSVYDKQLGSLAILRVLADLDPSIEKPSPKKPKPETKPAVESKTIWAQIIAVLTALGGALTDWKVATVLIIGAIAAFVIWERVMRGDQSVIKGWFSK
jgi:lysozyme family protein